jgi:hypothetical protein
MTAGVTLAIARLESTFRDGREKKNGTAFAFTPVDVLTAFHCVQDDNGDGTAYTDNILLYFQNVQIRAKVIALSARFDVAVLRLERPLPKQLTPIGLVRDCQLNEQWNSAGYPHAVDHREVSGTPLAGRVTATSVPILGGVPAIGLHCDQAAAGLPMQGASGAPVLVGPTPAAVGLIRWNPPSATRDIGTVLGAGIYATDLSLAARELGNLRLPFWGPHRPRYTHDPDLDRHIMSLLPVGKPQRRSSLTKTLVAVVALVLAVVMVVIGVRYAIGSITPPGFCRTTSDPGNGPQPTGTTTPPNQSGPGDVGPCPPSASAAIAISPSRGPVGTTITVTGKCFDPNERVEILFHLDVIAQPVASADGSFTAKGPVPTRYRSFAGKFPFRVIATGKDSGKTDTQPFDLTC